MQEKILENHKRYLERIEFYKGFGYDINKERNLIFQKSKPIFGNILEVGTGKGHFTLELVKSGYKLTSIDISEEEQEFARLNVSHFGFDKQVDFRIENAERLSFQDASFDVIFSINTVHHLNNPFKVIDEFIRILTQEGKIILSDFNKDGLKLMDKIHQSEHRKHEAGTVNLADIEQYLVNKKLITKEYKSKFQDILIASKN